MSFFVEITLKDHILTFSERKKRKNNEIKK